ncbi:MAG: OadG family protein [Filifactoraceae bacterium]
MSINDIIAQMKVDVSALSFGEKLIGGIAVTVLSMLIVFIVLSLLRHLIKVMSMIMNRSLTTNKEVVVGDKTFLESKKDIVETLNITDEEQEIAVIMAAISSMISVGESKLVIRKIAYVGESNWSMQGRISQIENRR